MAHNGTTSSPPAAAGTPARGGQTVPPVPQRAYTSSRMSCCHYLREESGAVPSQRSARSPPVT